MKLRNFRLATATSLSVLALVGLSSQAHAGAFAYAELQVTGFEVQTVTGNTLGGAPNGELTNAFTPTGGVAGGNINVTSANDSFTSLAAINGTSNTSITNGGVACVGSCPANAFAFQPAPPITSNFSQAEATLSPTAGGTTFPAPVISFAPIGSGATPSIGGGANAHTVAQTQLTGTAQGQASSTIGLTSGFNFSVNGAPGTTTTVALTFNAIVKLIAGLDATGLSSQASSALSFTITDLTKGGTVFSWAPDGTLTANVCAAGVCKIVSDPFSVNTSAVNATTPGATDTVSNGPGAFEAEITLDNGDLYSFGINHETQTLVLSVPEPGSIALLSAGLLGLGALARRRRRRLQA